MNLKRQRGFCIVSELPSCTKSLGLQAGEDVNQPKGAAMKHLALLLMLYSAHSVAADQHLVDAITNIDTQTKGE